MIKKEDTKKFNNLLNQKKYKEAKNYLEKQLESGDEEKQKINNLFGWLYDQWALNIKDELKRKDYQRKAKDYFKKNIGNENFKIEALRGLGTVFMHQEKLIPALKYYKKAYEAEKNFNTCNDLGNIYRRLNKDELSISFYKEALALTRNKEESAIPLFNLIKINEEIENQKGKEKYLQMLKNLSEKSDFAKMMLERIKNN